MYIHAPVAPDAIGPRRVTLPAPAASVMSTPAVTPGSPALQPDADERGNWINLTS